MKLLSKYNRINIPITIVSLIISCIAFYFILHYVLVKQLDKDLKIEKAEILHFVNTNSVLPEASDYKDQQINFEPTNATEFATQFYTKEVYEKHENEMESVRVMKFYLTLNGKNYIVNVSKSQQETEDIVQMILTIILSVIILLVLILFLVNRFILSKLWNPFNHTLSQLKQFNLSVKNEIRFDETTIQEFSELNKTVLEMTNKMRSDYDSLKNFAENASHEIQTPLSIIRTKLELLAQSENLDADQMGALQTLNETTSRLSKLNQSLLLLTKIDNRQFVETERVNFSMALLNYFEQFDELIQLKNITITKSISENIFVEMNDSLADILISNILSNAIKHNIDNGYIEVILNENELVISNSGLPPITEPSQLFERFKKDSTLFDSLGLGLSIVHKIVEISGYSISYTFQDEQHILKIIFNKN